MPDPMDHTKPGTGAEWPIRRLVERLREIGLRVGVREADLMFLLASANEAWSRERLRHVLATSTPGVEADRRLFDTAFDSVFPPGTDPIHPFRAQRRPDPAQSETPPYVWPEMHLAVSPPEGPPGKVLAPPGGTTRSLADVIGSVWRVLLSDALGIAILVLILCGLVALIVYGQAPGDAGPFQPPDQSEQNDVPRIAWAFAALAAAGILGPILFALRWLTQSEPVIRRPPVRSVSPDWSETFRIGLVGGPPPRTLDAERARSLVDLFAYRLGDEDRSALDVQASIAEIVRTGGMPAIRHPLLRVLPTIVLLVDTLSPARFWNRLPDELAETLGQRGLDIRVLGFQGSLHLQGSPRRPDGAGPIEGGGPVRTPAAIALAEIAEDEAATAVLVFSDGRNWQEQDTALLRGLSANGPVFWFDDRDRELWDASLDGLRRAGIPIWEATAAGVEEALRVAYAPGRGVGGRARTAGRALGRRVGRSLADEIPALLGAAMSWAGHCAYLQPISFALADRIRRTLHPGLGWIVFSRLVALPGSRVGPEGLRFDPAVRSVLLAHLARIEPARSRHGAVNLLAGALAEVRDRLPADTPGRALGDLAIATVELHRDPDAAVRRMVRLRADGLVDGAAVDSLLSRLRPPEAAGATLDRGGAEITIGAPIRDATTLTALGMDGLPDRPPAPTVRWDISSPEFRAAMAPRPQWSGPAAVFAPGDRLIVVSEEVRIIELPAGLEQFAFRLPEPPLRIAAEGGVVAFGFGRAGASAWFLPDPAAGPAPKPVPREIPPDNAPVSLVAVSPRSGQAYAFSETLVTAFGETGEPARWTWQLGSPPTAACPFGQDLLVGTQDGRLAMVAPGAAFELDMPPLRRAIRALSVAEHSGGSEALVAIAYGAPDGSGGSEWFLTLIGLAARSARLEGVPPWRVQRGRGGLTVPLAGEPLELELSEDAGTLMILTSAGLGMLDTQSGLALLSAEAEDLVAGLGTGGPRSARILAADLAGRRLALFTEDPPRLEVRRLERIDSTSSAALEEEPPDPEVPLSEEGGYSERG